MTAHLPIADQAAMRAAPALVRELHTIRLRQDRTAEEVSRAIGVAKNMVWRWETGRNTPAVDAVIAWADALGYELILRTKEVPA